MKKTVLAAVFAALAATAAYATDPGVTELESNGWFRYQVETKKFNLSNPDVAQFRVERGYLRLKRQFNTQLAAKVTVDMLSSDGYADGAALRLKEAYIDFGTPIQDLTLTAGLQKNYFSLIYSWDYTNPEKSLGDKEGVLASSDYGVTANGFLPSGLGEYQLGIYNGEGYKNSLTKLNKSPTLDANLRLTPFAGVQVGASVFYNKVDNVKYKNDVAAGKLSPDRHKWLLPDTGNTKRLGIAPMLKLAAGPVSLMGEFISYSWTREFGYYTADSVAGTHDSTRIASDKKYAQSGFSVVPVVTLLHRKLELQGRFDMWNVKAAGSDGSMVKDTLASHMLYGAGFNYHFFRREKGKPGVEFQFNWERQQATATSQAPKDYLTAQFRFEWMSNLKD